MKKKRAVAVLALILAAIIAVSYFAYVVVQDTGTNGKKKSNSIKLGLDLAGGVSITYQIQDKDPSKTDIDDTIAKLEERAESYSTEYAVYKNGDNRITVEIPGIKDANAVLEDLGSPGTLYFIKQHDAQGNENYSMQGTTGKTEKDYKLNKSIDELIKDGSVIMDGNGVKEAKATYQQDQTLGTSEPVVSMEFTSKAAKDFATATTEASQKGDSIGIYYDDHFISVPSVNTPITDGKCVIEGFKGDNKTKDERYTEASTLATFIRAGAINLKLKEIESNVVGASLGNDALANSLKAGMIGLVIVILFMIFMYYVPGLAASLALILYTSLVIAIVQLFEITLTLPGIAGIILGIGMAVDANVITFARIREEISAGKSVGNAIKVGYKKALSAILDGNVTTFIAAFVLMILGSGTVKGFANTLMISIIVSMFTALVVSKNLIMAFHALGIRDEKLYGKAKKLKPIRFIQNRGKYYAISVLIIVVGIGGMIYHSSTSGKALNYSLEFMGGTSTTADFGKKYTIDEIDKEVVPVVRKAVKNTDIQATTVAGTKKIVLKTRTLSLSEREKLAKSLNKEFNIKKDGIETQSISSTISGEMRRSAVEAVIVACICMLIYIWIRFKDIRFGTSAILALVHDVLVVLTLYAIVRVSAGTTFIAVMLTIVGYSVNDTIVIFDRIRENLKGNREQTPDAIADIANESLIQTLSRSINTSITTFVMVFCLYIFGVASIKDFALPLMVGLISGSYSSIFVATELWYDMKLRFGKKKLSANSSSKSTKKATKKESKKAEI
ncbi:SecD/SecF fusion protein [Lachnospiraceae bacterium C7]|nr:SecD/SecF fusion protein [Lachnospiraceae bacterium C7]